MGKTLCGLFHALLGFGLLIATPLFAQNASVETNASLTAPPVFQGLMVDAKGKTVGRLVVNVYGTNFVVRQISGAWVELPVDGVTTGFQITNNNNTVAYYYQSIDCTGQAYFSVSQANNNVGPAYGVVATVPPATAPSIYFAGTPASKLVMHSGRSAISGCGPINSPDGFPIAAGPAQIVPVSSLGLTLPFSIK